MYPGHVINVYCVFIRGVARDLLSNNRMCIILSLALWAITEAGQVMLPVLRLSPLDMLRLLIIILFFLSISLYLGVRGFQINK